jgi:hypothetical protein
VKALDVLAGGDEQLSGVPGRDAKQLGCAWRGARDEVIELLVERCDLRVEVLDAPGQAAQRELGGLPRLVDGIDRATQLATQRGLGADRRARVELFA